MLVNAVFFDIDGTLVDSNEFHVMAWQEAFRDHGHVFELKTIRGQIGKGGDQLVPALVPQIDKRTCDEIADRHGEIFGRRYLDQVRPFPHATDIVETLHAKGKRVVFASSAKKAEVEYYVDLLKVGHFLHEVVTMDDVASSKPAGDIFAAALASVFPLGASETLAIGDTPYDVEAALKVDVKTIALRSGGASEQMLMEAGAAFVFASVKELFEHFDSSPLSDQ
jgi:membrane protein